MPTEKEYENNTIEINLECAQCSIEYSVYTGVGGYLEQARYCPFCGSYNLDYEREED
jgi:ribosomal protein L33